MKQSEKNRAELYLGLRQALGNPVAILLMERLPPDDFARFGEAQLLTLRMDLLDRRIDDLTGTMKVMIGSMITVSTVMIGLLVQIALSAR